MISISVVALIFLTLGLFSLGIATGIGIQTYLTRK